MIHPNRSVAVMEYWGEKKKQSERNMKDGKRKEKRKTSLVKALHLALLIHFSLSITVMYAND